MTRLISTTLMGLLTLAGATACTPSDLQGECVPGIDYSDEPAIIPSDSPFIMCAVSPAPPTNERYGNFLINNCGRQVLSIESAEISNEASPEVFADLELGADKVPAGDSIAARFKYTAVDTLEHRGKITIKSNAKNFPELYIDVVVRADEPTDGGFCSPVGGGSDAGVGEDR